MRRERLQSRIEQARAVVAFTGAGVSAESGIPTYRGTGGVWNAYDPDKYANIRFFLSDPSYYWNFFKDVRYPALREAKPNAAHRKLAEMEGSGRLQAIITQNIDGLHQEAGSGAVLELHGNTRSFSCLSCSEQHELEEVRSLLEVQLPPPCRACGGQLKPDVVMFGESLPAETLQAAKERAAECDLFLAIGSSLVVQPAASLPVLAKKSGAALAIINPDPTRLDDLADLVLRESASSALAGC